MHTEYTVSYFEHTVLNLGVFFVAVGAKKMCQKLQKKVF